MLYLPLDLRRRKGNRLPTRRDIKEKKGIHPITTAILLVIILLAISGIVYIWITIQNRTGNAIFIQSVKFEQTKTIIYVQNTGYSTVTIDSVQINNQTFSIHITNCTVASQETTMIQQGQTAVITITRLYNERVHIKVYCKDGTFNEGDWQP
jgi:hypothetical protein